MPVIDITISRGRSVGQKRELIKVLTRETARIMQTQEEKVRILIYEVSKENWGKRRNYRCGYETGKEKLNTILSKSNSIILP